MLLPALRGHVHDRSLRRWLSRARLEARPARTDRLSTVLDELGHDAPVQGRAALRMWGQTGDRPRVWIAAADPIYLEPRLDHLCLHALDSVDLPVADLRRLVDHLQSTLGEGQAAGFVRLGSCAYLRANEPFPTAVGPARNLDQQVPTAHMPAGPDADSYRQLVSEIEMALHGHPVNTKREARDLRPVNSFWLWGGGYAPEPARVPHPPLFTDDPLLRGYWESVVSQSAAWPGSISACFDKAGDGFVAVVPDEGMDGDLPARALTDLRDLVETGRIARLHLLTDDGLRVTVRRRDRYRFWRRESRLLLGDSR